MIKQICELMRERWYITLPVLVGLTVTIFAGKHLNSFIPADLNSTSWQSNIDKMNKTLHMTSTFSQIAFLTSIHCFQVYMLFPFLHVTKILYGFWLGPLWGWLLCCAWELTLIYAYLLRIHTNPHKEVEKIIQEARVAGILWTELIILALSHSPLQVNACVLEFGGVTLHEFFTANILVTSIMSFKNTFCGFLLSKSFSITNFALIGTIITLSTLIPTFATLYVSSKTFHKCFQIYRAQNSKTIENTNEPIKDVSNPENI